MSPDNFIAISGGFDMCHIGHIRMIDDAAGFGKVVVLLNSDGWLIRKKGYFTMPFEERKEIVQSIRNVHIVLPAFDNDGTVCESLTNLKDVIHFFGNGGDRTPASSRIEEIALCEKLGVPIIYGLGGGKVQSSSAIMRRLSNLIAPRAAGDTVGDKPSLS